MKKKIVADLTSLAHKVLQLKNHDTATLKTTAQQLYDKLCMLEFIESHFEAAGPTIGKEKALQILEDIVPITGAPTPTAQEALPETPDEQSEAAHDEEEEAIAFASNDLSDLFLPVDHDTREVMDLPGIATISKMVEEMPDELPETTAVNSDDDLMIPKTPITPPPVPVAPPALPGNKTPDADTKNTTAADLKDLTEAFQTMPEFERKTATDVPKQVSLNDRLNKGLVIGMNDRLGFVKHLFGGSDQDLNRVLSQLNTMESFAAAKDFVENMVKPDYNHWSGKESYENRFMDLLERKFDS